ERGFAAGRRDDDRAAALAETFVGDADDRDGGDRRMVLELLLDLSDADVLAAADHNVLDPAGDLEVAILVQAPQIAEPVPLAVEGAARQLGITHVANENVRALGDDLALLAGRQWTAPLVGYSHLHAGDG